MLILFLISNFISYSAQAQTSPGAVCETGKEAFAKTLHPLLLQRCTKCHGDTGDETGHSVTDVSKAYEASMKLVDFINADRSRFVIKVKQKHWLNYDSTQVGMTEDEMRSALMNWWSAGQNSCPLPFQFVSNGTLVPTNLPDRASGQYVNLIFNLGEYATSLSGCTLSIGIQRFTQGSGTVPGSFRVSTTMVKCSVMFKIERLWFLVNGGAESYENIYDGINQTILPSNNFQTLDTRSMILMERPGVNTISIAIGDIGFSI